MFPLEYLFPSASTILLSTLIYLNIKFTPVLRAMPHFDFPMPNKPGFFSYGLSLPSNFLKANPLNFYLWVNLPKHHIYYYNPYHNLVRHSWGCFFLPFMHLFDWIYYSIYILTKYKFLNLKLGSKLANKIKLLINKFNLLIISVGALSNICVFFFPFGLGGKFTYSSYSVLPNT